MSWCARMLAVVALLVWAALGTRTTGIGADDDRARAGRAAVAIPYRRADAVAVQSTDDGADPARTHDDVLPPGTSCVGTRIGCSLSDVSRGSKRPLSVLDAAASSARGPPWPIVRA